MGASGGDIGAAWRKAWNINKVLTPSYFRR
jgi:hypothetical protein